MCWLSKNHILKNVIAELEADKQNSINTINEYKNKTDNFLAKIDELENDIKILNHNKELQCDKLEKHNKTITDLQTILRQYENTIADLTPSNTVLFYFTGYNNSKNKDKIKNNIKNTLKNKVDKIFIKTDGSMYNPLKNSKYTKKVPKIPLNRKIIKGSFGQINDNLKNGKKVVLVGENYGGSVINRIIDLYIRDYTMYDVTDLLQNLYCYTFGSPYNPSRNYIPQPIQSFVNSNNIANYMFKDDIITKYDNGTPPANLEYNTWIKDQCRLEKWSLSNYEYPNEIHFSYNVLDILLQELPFTD